MKAGLLIVLALAASLLAAPAGMAHHGAAAYEQKLTTIKGTVTEFQFINPHAIIAFDVTDGSGQTRNWIAEGVSATAMSRGGWSRSTLKPGDQITITGNCAKNGTPTMRLSRLILPNGKGMSVTRGEDDAAQ